jgi:hypothetical protein
MRPLEFADMRQLPGLQAADLLAYELRHHFYRRRRAPSAQPRLPLLELSQQYTYYYQSRIIPLKYLPDWYITAERDGTLDTKLDEIFGDIDRFARQASELLAFPPHPDVYKQLERYSDAPSRKPQVIFLPAGASAWRRKLGVHVPVGPPACPDSDKK